MTRIVAATAALILTIGSSSSLAYLKLGAMVNGQIVDATWHQQPIGYFISERNGTGVSAVRRTRGRRSRPPTCVSPSWG